MWLNSARSSAKTAMPASASSMESSQLPLAPLPFRISGTVTARCMAASAAWSARLAASSSAASSRALASMRMVAAEGRAEEGDRA